MKSSPLLIRAAMIADGESVLAAPGALLVDGGRIIAVGTPQALGVPAEASVIDLPQSVLLPPLVNAHCHLDLSHLGPTPFPGDFVSWAESLRRRRAVDDAEIAASVRRGIELSRAGGTALLGDIAGMGSRVPLGEMRRARMPGVSFLEVFGIGRRQGKAIEALRRAVDEIEAEENGVRLGLQPHAPYSCGPEVYRAAAGLGRPLATHLAETLQELRFVRTADGPLADLLRRIGVWDDSITGQGRHPIDALAEALAAAPMVAAHLNYIEPAHIELMRRWPLTVAYCPRASAYFGHPHDGRPPHQYRAMMEAGVNVALGTDSLLCLDTPDRISVLDDMRFLFRRDGVDPHLLLRMATVNGAAALGFDQGLVTLAPGPALGVLAVAIDPADGEDPLRQVMRSREAPRWLIGPLTVADAGDGAARLPTGLNSPRHGREGCRPLP